MNCMGRLRWGWGLVCVVSVPYQHFCYSTPVGKGGRGIEHVLYFLLLPYILLLIPPSILHTLPHHLGVQHRAIPPVWLVGRYNRSPLDWLVCQLCSGLGLEGQMGRQTKPVLWLSGWLSKQGGCYSRRCWYKSVFYFQRCQQRPPAMWHIETQYYLTVEEQKV